MKIIRQVRNVLDGKYTVREADEERKPETSTGSGFREGESRVVKKLIDAGLLIPQGDTKPRRDKGI